VPPRTLLIGLDGATFSILDPLMEDGVMPFLRRFSTRGVRAELLSTSCPLTPQAWPAVMTGRSPGNTGVYDFVRFEMRPHGPYVTMYDSRDLKCETIWSIASRNDRTVTSLNFILMYPPRPIAGKSVSGFIPFRHLKDGVYPPDYYGKIKVLPGFNARELAMDLELEKKCIAGLPEEQYEDWILLHIRREQQWFELVRHLMVNEPTDLTAIVFDGVDKLQHLCWRFIDPRLFPSSPSSWEKHIRSLCLRYFEQLDGFLLELVSLVGSDGRMICVSDHGFCESTEIFYINTWLAKNGYLKWTDDGDLDSSERLSANRLKDHVGLVDWAKTTAYAFSPSSNGVFIRRSGDGSDSGVSPEDYQAFRRRLVEALSAFKDPVTGDRVVTNVQTREEAYPGAYTHLAPDLLVTLRDHGFVSTLNSDSPLKRRKHPVGTHHPEGIFIAGGAGIKSAATAGPLSILDVAPTILFSLDVPIPKNFEGRVPVEVFEPSFLGAHPIRFSRTESQLEEQQAMPLSASQMRAEESIQEAILDRLKALGYIEDPMSKA
jgi:predicted AlkP superfamily phosphohydrolase/phosphomutase